MRELFDDGTTRETAAQPKRGVKRADQPYPSPFTSMGKFSIRWARATPGAANRSLVLECEAVAEKVYLPSHKLKYPSYIRYPLLFIGRYRTEDDPPASQIYLALLPQEFKDLVESRMNLLALDRLLRG